MISIQHLFVAALLTSLALPANAWGQETLAERVEFSDANGKQIVFGEVLVEAEDGGVLLLGPDQTIWPIQPEAIVSRHKLDECPQALTADELAGEVLKELPDTFRVHNTRHYVICYNTSELYAQWCGGLFERLHRAFHNYWSRRGIDFHDTPPLVACVFRDKESYEQYGTRELGKSAKSMLGYYSFSTNRIAMYDLLGGASPRTPAQMNQLLRRQERTVATVIHEATHQIAFNSGLHQRFAEIPLWLSEGLAIFFETPDLKSTRGWTTIGAVNYVRLRQFLASANRRDAGSLTSLVATDARFQTVALATDAYAESWAFCYYLIRRHAKSFATYLEILQTKKALDEVDKTPEQRLKDFETAFGKPPAEFERDFLTWIRKIR